MGVEARCKHEAQSNGDEAQPFSVADRRGTHSMHSTSRSSTSSTTITEHYDAIRGGRVTGAGPGMPMSRLFLGELARCCSDDSTDT